MIKNTIGASLLALGLVGATSSQAIIVIDSFETGGLQSADVLAGVTVSTDYNYVAPGANVLFPAKTMAEVSTTQGNHIFWGLPTTTPTVPGPGLGQQFLAVNGSLVPSDKVLQYDGITVSGTAALPKIYFFEAWLTALFPAAPADVNFTVQFKNAGGTVLKTTTGTVTSPSTVNSWALYSVPATNDVGAVKATIIMNNAETAFTGNDFGVDFITFDTDRQTAVPEVSTGISAGVFALVGGLIVLRRRKAAQVA